MHRPGGLALLLTALCAPATATTYMAPLDRAAWQVEQSRLSCRLRHAIPRYGDAVFEARAGGGLQFVLSAAKNPMQGGAARLIADAPLWNPELAPIELGTVEVLLGPRPLALDAELARQLLQALERGLAPQLSRPALADSEALVTVGLSPARFRGAYGQYRDCVAKLLPLSVEQVASTALQFGNQQVKLDATARGKLDTLLGYLKAGHGPATLAIDAVSSETPRRLENLELARERALAVSEYLVSRGVAPQRIISNYRGERGARRAAVTVKVRWKEKEG